MLTRTAVLLALASAACVLTDEPEASWGLDSGLRTASVDDASGVELDELGTVPDPDVCALLPEYGACSLACDPVALAEQYLPPNTCATLRCDLTNGQTISVHACNVGDD